MSGGERTASEPALPIGTEIYWGYVRAYGEDGIIFIQSLETLVPGMDWRGSYPTNGYLSLVDIDEKLIAQLFGYPSWDTFRDAKQTATKYGLQGTSPQGPRETVIQWWEENVFQPLGIKARPKDWTRVSGPTSSTAGVVYDITDILEVGQTVRIRRDLADQEPMSGPGITEEMIAAAGNVYTIRDRDERGSRVEYRLREIKWCWTADWFERV